MYCCLRTLKMKPISKLFPLGVSLVIIIVSMVSYKFYLVVQSIYMDSFLFVGSRSQGLIYYYLLTIISCISFSLRELILARYIFLVCLSVFLFALLCHIYVGIIHLYIDNSLTVSMSYSSLVAVVILIAGFLKVEINFWEKLFAITIILTLSMLSSYWFYIIWKG